MQRGAVNAPNQNAKKTIVNAFKKENLAQRSVAVSTAKTLRPDSPIFHIVYFSQLLNSFEKEKNYDFCGLLLFGNIKKNR